MINELQVFEKDNKAIRTISECDQIWFVAKDIALALEYSEASNPARLFANVPECWKGVKRIHTLGGEQEMLCLTEQGAYFFLGRSDKPKALPYQMWISGEVVPSIRKHGGYLTEDLIANPDLIIKLAQALKAERARTEKDRPKVIFADAVNASKDTILIGNLAKLLRQNGIKMGQNRLFLWLREHNYLMSCKGERWNMPTQESIDKGLFIVKEQVINNPDGSTRITYTTKVTGKGQIYFINLFMEEKRKR